MDCYLPVPPFGWGGTTDSNIHSANLFGAAVPGQNYLPERLMCEPNVIETVIEHRKVTYEEKIVELPKIIYKEKVVEVEERVPMEKIIHVPKIEYQERQIEVPVVEYREKIVEVPSIEYVDKYVEVPKVIYQEKIIPVNKTEYQERIIEVPKIELLEKIVENVQIQYQEVIEERIVEVPEIQTEYVYRDVPVKQQKFRPMPVDKMVELPHQKFVERIVKKPIVQYREVDKFIDVPLPEKRYVRQEKIIPRLVIVPQAVDRYEEVEVPKYVTRTVERPYPVTQERIVKEEYKVEVPVERLVERRVPVCREIQYFREIPVPVSPEPLIQTMEGLLPFSQFLQQNKLQQPNCVTLKPLDENVARQLVGSPRSWTGSGVGTTPLGRPLGGGSTSSTRRLFPGMHPSVRSFPASSSSSQQPVGFPPPMRLVAPQPEQASPVSVAASASSANNPMGGVLNNPEFPRNYFSSLNAPTSSSSSPRKLSPVPRLVPIPVDPAAGAGGTTPGFVQGSSVLLPPRMSSPPRRRRRLPNMPSGGVSPPFRDDVCNSLLSSSSLGGYSRNNNSHPHHHHDETQVRAAAAPPR